MINKNDLRKKILDWVEKDRFSLTSALIYITVLGIIRSFLDSLVKNHGWYNIYEMAHYVFVAYPEFLLGSLLIFALTRAPIRKVWNVVLLGFWLLLIPPIVDFFILGEHGAEVGVRYGYLTMDELQLMLRTVLLNPLQRPSDIASTGQVVMFLSMIIGAAAYIALKTDLPGKFITALKRGKNGISDFGVSVGKVVLTYYGLLLTYWIIGALQFIVRIGNESIVLFNMLSYPVEKKYYDFFYTHGYTSGEVFPEGYVARMGLLENLAYNQLNLLFGFIFLVIGVIVLFISLRLCYKKTLNTMLRNLRVLDTLMLISAAFVGIASLHLIDGDFSKGFAIDPFYILHTQYVLFCFLTVFLLAQFSFLFDDIYAYKRDESRDDPLSRGDIPYYHYKQLTIAYALSALFISYVLGRWTLILALVWILVSILTSIVFTESSQYSGIIKGVLMGASAFCMGYFTPASWIAFILEHADGEWIYASNETITRTPVFTSATILLLLWVAIGIALTSFFSDKDTYFYTKTSQKIKLSNMVYIVIPILFLFPLLSFYSLFGVILILSLAVGTIKIFNLFEDKIFIKAGFLLFMVAFSFLLF